MMQLFSSLTKTLYHGILLAGVILIFFSCANVVSPTGGPVDENPPEVIRSTPPNYFPNFDGDEIRIFFNEFVELRNIRQQMLISPPLERLPEVRIRGRSIIMEIEEELRPNTTYNFFFGEAIRDITEGNPIPNYQFVLSTGDYVDSLSLGGQVFNAYTLEPEEGVYVMLYDDHRDSVPYLERPVYLAKTDKQGQFTISYMKEGEYRMFALDDENNNFLYDPPEERIAFLDSLVKPEFAGHLHLIHEKRPEDEHDHDHEPPHDQDHEHELEHDHLPHQDQPRPDPPGLMPADEAYNIADTLDHAEETKNEIPFFTLYMFQEKDTLQRIIGSTTERKGMIRLTFRVPFDSVHVRDIRQPLEEDAYIAEFGLRRDTMNLWLKDLDRDSLFLEVKDRETILDTLKLSTVPRERRGRRPAGEEGEEELPGLQLDINVPRGGLPFFRPLAISASSPVEDMSPAKIQLFIHDTIPVETSFSFQDHVRRKILTDTLPEPGSDYRIEILPGAFTDIFGATNDTLIKTFKTTEPEEYGLLIINLSLPEEGPQYILKLLDNNQEVRQRKTVHENGYYRFPYLTPGHYGLKLVKDLQKTGQWTTGKYLDGVQPEPVFIYPQELHIRQNWELEEPWVVTPRE